MKTIITEEDVISLEIANGIHDWIHEQGDEIFKYSMGIDRAYAIKQVVKHCMEKGRKKVEKWKDNLNGKTPKWFTRVLLNEGYGKQCVDLEPFEADNEKEAQKISEKKVEGLYSEKLNVDIIEIKVKRL